MKESTKINMERNFEAATAGMVSGIAEGFGCEIIGYDPYCYTNQTITIKYRDKETTFDIHKEEFYTTIIYH